MALTNVKNLDQSVYNWYQNETYHIWGVLER